MTNKKNILQEIENLNNYEKELLLEFLSTSKKDFFTISNVNWIISKYNSIEANTLVQKHILDVKNNLEQEYWKEFIINKKYEKFKLSMKKLSTDEYREILLNDINYSEEKTFDWVMKNKPELMRDFINKHFDVNKHVHYRFYRLSEKYQKYKTEIRKNLSNYFRINKFSDIVYIPYFEGNKLKEKLINKLNDSILNKINKLTDEDRNILYEFLSQENEIEFSQIALSLHGHIINKKPYVLFKNNKNIRKKYASLILNGFLEEKTDLSVNEMKDFLIKQTNIDIDRRKMTISNKKEFELITDNSLRYDWIIKNYPTLLKNYSQEIFSPNSYKCCTLYSTRDEFRKYRKEIYEYIYIIVKSEKSIDDIIDSVELDSELLNIDFFN